MQGDGAHDKGGDQAEAAAKPSLGSAAGRMSAADPRRVHGDVLPLVATELRVPAALLLRHVRQLRRSGNEEHSPEARRAFLALEEQARRIAAVADVLGELDAIERGELHLRQRPVQLGAVLARIVDARAPESRACGVDVHYSGPDEPLTVSADPHRFTRAMNAVIDDALAAASGGGRIDVALDASDDAARITVTVEPRSEAGGAQPRGRRSSGVAVAVARRLVEMHGGALQLEDADGACTVRMSVPLGPTAAYAKPRTVSAGAKAKLLVVDDDPDVRETLSMMLGENYEVLLAADGREALERAMADRPDVVLMDLYMPRMDGLAALEAMRSDAATEDLPVIFISARGDDLTRSRSLDVGAVDFLQKPFSARELKARIERTLRLTRREIELQMLARTDPLTGLANLRAFRARLDEEVKRARRYRTPLACVMVDMDRLKPINDAMGHAAGDAAIRAVADVIRRELRGTDFGARYGGDEFVLLLPHTTGAEASVFAERVRARLHDTPVRIRGRELPLEASFGIASLDDDAPEDAGETLVRRADAALYDAKRGGRDRVASHPSAGPGQPAPLA